jgi:glycerol-3-phosphate dehydrogenase
VAVPGPYLIETLEKFQVVDKDTLIETATKGLDNKGRLPSKAIKDIWGSRWVMVTGGACISTEDFLDLQYGKEELEMAGILKNVYSIGFSIERARFGDNAAAVWFIKAWKELHIVVSKEEYFSDFVVTAMSDKSRNNRAGRMIAEGKKVMFEDNQIAEGVHTAEMIKKYKLFKNLPLLMETVGKITLTKKR